jgi:hypothetical protein
VVLTTLRCSIARWTPLRPRAAIFVAAVSLAGCKYESFNPKLPPLPTYTVKQLGLLQGGSQSQATAGSASAIVGWATDAGGAPHAVTFVGGQAVRLTEPVRTANSEALGVNASGVIVGFATIAGVSQALVWGSPTSAPMLLGALGGTYSQAARINDDNKILGAAQTDSGDTVLTTWQQADSSYSASRVDPAGGVADQPVAINNLGELAGNLGGGRGGFFWNTDVGWDSISAPSGALTTVNGMNNYGIVVGSTQDKPGLAFAFTTNLSSEALGTAPSGYTTLAANAINDNGLIAGTASTVAVNGGALTSTPAVLSVTNVSAQWTALPNLGGPLAQPASNGITPCGVIVGAATTSSAPTALLAVAWVPSGCIIP